MFVTTVCFLFLLKLKWQKNKNICVIKLPLAELSAALVSCYCFTIVGAVICIYLFYFIFFFFFFGGGGARGNEIHHNQTLVKYFLVRCVRLPYLTCLKSTTERFHALNTRWHGHHSIEQNESKVPTSRGSPLNKSFLLNVSLKPLCNELYHRT